MKYKEWVVLLAAVGGISEASFSPLIHNSVTKLTKQSNKNIPKPTLLLRGGANLGPITSEVANAFNLATCIGYFLELTFNKDEALIKYFGTKDPVVKSGSTFFAAAILCITISEQMVPRFVPNSLTTVMQISAIHWLIATLTCSHEFYVTKRFKDFPTVALNLLRTLVIGYIAFV